MLFGEHLSRSHKHRLIPRADHLQHGGERHHGFAGSDFTLQQALHRPVTSQVSGDIFNYLMLTSSQFKWQGCDEPITQISYVRRAGCAGFIIAAQQARMSRRLMSMLAGLQ